MTIELRRFDESHEDLLTALEQQDDVWESVGTLPLSAYDAGNHVFAVMENGEELGFAGLFKSQTAGRGDFELVCATRSEAQHRGLARQACQLVLDWALGEARMERVIACIDDSNQPARAIAAKLGMTELGRASGNRILYAKYRTQST